MDKAYLFSGTLRELLLLDSEWPPRDVSVDRRAVIHASPTCRVHGADVSGVDAPHRAGSGRLRLVLSGVAVCYGCANWLIFTVRTLL